jgi:hypothetical protein
MSTGSSTVVNTHTHSERERERERDRERERERERERGIPVPVNHALFYSWGFIMTCNTLVKAFVMLNSN